MELDTSNSPPLTPRNTPNDFFAVIGSLRTAAANSNTKMGTAVAIMEASTGEELFNPMTNSHWLMPTPHKAQMKSVPKSFGRTFSFGMKRDTNQNIMQAKIARMMVIASGGTSEVSRYLNTGILTPNRMFADNISICPFIFRVTRGSYVSAPRR